MDPESFVRWSPTLTAFVLVDVVREDPNTTKDGPSVMARQRNADDGPTLNADLVDL